MKFSIYLLVVFLVGSFNLNAIDFKTIDTMIEAFNKNSTSWRSSNVNQWGFSTASIGWKKYKEKKLVGYHGINLFSGLGRNGLEFTLGWGSSDYLLEPRKNSFVPYWHWGVNILGSIYPYIGIGVEFENKDGLFFCFQTVNSDELKIGGGVRF